MIIQAYDFPNCNYVDGAADLLFFIDKTIETADGEIVTYSDYEDGGKWYRKVVCQITNGKLSVPGFELPATSTSDNPEARWIPVLVRKGETLDFSITPFGLNETISGNITWQEIRREGRKVSGNTRPEFYTRREQDLTFLRKPEFNALVAELIANTPSTTENPILSGGGFYYE